MRLACIVLPAFPLQVEALDRPELIGRPIAVLGVGPRPEVVACSREAFHSGVRAGMSPGQARARIGDLAVLAGSPRRWRDEIVELAADLNALAGAGPGVDLVDLSEALRGDGVAAQPSLFLEVPAGQRSERFGRRLLDVLMARDFRGRVGIAADRFTARAAARTRSGSGVIVVTRAGAAAFLAPLPIELLPLRAEVRALLHAAGIDTLGEFAALPPPSAECRAAGDIDYQELARGNGPGDLHPTPRTLPRLPARPAPVTPRRRSGGPTRQLGLAS